EVVFGERRIAARGLAAQPEHGHDLHTRALDPLLVQEIAEALVHAGARRVLGARGPRGGGDGQERAPPRTPPRPPPPGPRRPAPTALAHAPSPRPRSFRSRSVSSRLTRISSE